MFHTSQLAQSSWHACEHLRREEEVRLRRMKRRGSGEAVGRQGGNPSTEQAAFAARARAYVDAAAAAVVTATCARMLLPPVAHGGDQNVCASSSHLPHFQNEAQAQA